MTEVQIDTGAATLDGDLETPEAASRLVVFAHGSGSSRHSPRNRQVAERLNAAGKATLLFDLLTEEEARDRGKVFDIELLAGRLLAATAWARAHERTAQLPIGYFGASTGAAAALWAAAEDAEDVQAVVSRGGRPDLAKPVLDRVTAPTLLIVGECDLPVIEMNRDAQTHLLCTSAIEIVPDATHLFEEPGALEQVADLAAEWFSLYLNG